MPQTDHSFLIYEVQGIMMPRQTMRRLFSIFALLFLCTLSGAVQAFQVHLPGVDPNGSREGVHLVADAGDSDSTEAELAVWNAIKTTGNLELLKAFVKAYPDSIFTPITRTMIANIEPVEPGEQSSNDPAESMTSADDTPKPLSETAALTEPDADRNPYDGTWRIAGKAHSFKRYPWSICQNPDSMNETFSIKNGEIDTVLTSRSRNTISMTGSVLREGSLELNFISSNTEKMRGTYKAELESDTQSIRFVQKFLSDGQAGCRYDFVLKRVR